MFETYITPRAARNKNLEWRYIINSRENVTLRQVRVCCCCCCFPSSDVTMVQMVRVGLCISTGACHGLGHASLTPSHVTHVSQCRQLYLDQRLVAVTQTGEVKVRDENINGIFCNNFSLTLGWDVQFSIMLLLSYNEFNPLTFNQLNIKYAQASWQLYQLYL